MRKHLISRFAGFLGVFALVLTVFACSENQPASLSPAFRQLPDSLFEGKMPPAEFAAAIRHLPLGMEIDSAYERMLFSDPLMQSMELALAHYLEYEKFPQIEEHTLGWLDLQRGIIFNIMNKGDSSRLFYQKAHDRAMALSDTATIGETLIGLAQLDMRSGHQTSAARQLVTATALYRVKPDSLGMLTALKNLGICYLIQKEWQKAEAAAREGLKYVNTVGKKAGHYELNLESTLANALFGQNRLEESLALVEKNLRRTESGELLFYRGDLLNQFAKICIAQKKWAEAVDSLRAVSRLPAEIIQKPREQISRNGLLARALYPLGQKSEAVACAENALKLASKSNDMESKADLDRFLSGVFEKEGQTAKAFLHLKNYQNLADSIYSNQQKSNFENLVEQEKTNAHERELDLSQARTEQERQRKWFFGIAGLLAALGIAVFFRLRQKNERLKLEKERAEQAAREQLQTLELQAAHRENELHTQQLDDFTQLLMEKNRQVEELTQQNRANTPLPSPVADHLSDLEPPDDGSDLEALYHQTILTEADWERFKTLFERVRPGFIPRIKHQFSGLTPSELRLILLLKMNMQTREMADMLGVSPETIKKSRYRLRKKLGLDDERLAERVQAM